MKSIVRPILNSLGFEIRRKTVLKPETECPENRDLHPLEAVCRTPWERSTEIWVEPGKVINSSGFTFSPRGNHAYVQTIKEYINGTNTEYEGSKLEQYYHNFKPANLGELMLGRTNKNGKLWELPPVDLGIPFIYFNTFDEVIGTALHWIKSENSRENLDCTDLILGSQSFGPTDTKKGIVEFNRLARVCESIMGKGFEREDKDTDGIKGYLLRRDEDYRVMIYGGHHRTAALSALGFQKIPVKLRTNFVIDEKDVKYWPLVSSGVWSETTALEYMNNLFRFERAGLYSFSELQAEAEQ